MNVDITLDALYVSKARFDYIALQLEQNGHRMAAEELRREAHSLGCQINQIEGVLEAYKIDIAVTQLPEKAPCLYGIDLSLPGEFKQVAW